jgi:hypothetical protein
MFTALSIRVKVGNPDEHPAQPRYLNMPMLVLGVGVELPAEDDGVLVPFPVETVFGLVVVLTTAEELPLTGLVGEDVWPVLFTDGFITMLAMLDVGTELEEPAEEGDVLVIL